MLVCIVRDYLFVRASGDWGTLSYTYDPVGNRLSETVNGTATNYAYSSYNKLQSAGTTSFTYDNNGNMLTRNDGTYYWNYGHDYENRLTKATLNGQPVFQAWYDGDGRRIQTLEGTNQTTYDYLQGSWDPIYVGNSLSGVTKVIFAGSFRIGEVQSGLNRYDHLDRLGSVRLVTNDATTQTFTTEYRPFGASFATSGSELFTFTGKQLQPSINLYYLGYRYLDCQSGRFTTPDLQEPNYQNPQSINRYPYALNNPNRYVDPNGRMFIEINDKGERIVGGFEAVTGKGLDQSDTQEPKERSPFGTEMQRQISLLTGNPPSSTSTTMPTSTTSTETTTATTTTTKTKQRNWLLIGVLVADVVAIWILAACLTSAGLGPLAIPLAAMATDIIGGEIANALANP